MVSKIMILFLILIAISNSANLTVTVTCVTCTVTCGFTNCFRVKGNGLDTQVCSAATTCNTSSSYNFIIGKSTTDMVGTACPSGLVVYLPSPMAVCIDPNQTCFQTSHSTQCANCQSTANCTKCLQTMVGGVENGEQCIGSSCGIIGVTNTTTNACTVDAFGNKCACCTTSTASTSTGGLSSCFQTFYQLNNPQVTSWIAANNNYSSIYNIAFLALLSVLFMII